MLMEYNIDKTQVEERGEWPLMRQTLRDIETMDNHHIKLKACVDWCRDFEIMLKKIKKER